MAQLLSDMAKQSRSWQHPVNSSCYGLHFQSESTVFIYYKTAWYHADNSVVFTQIIKQIKMANVTWNNTKTPFPVTKSILTSRPQSWQTALTLHNKEGNISAGNRETSYRPGLSLKALKCHFPWMTVLFYKPWIWNMINLLGCTVHCSQGQALPVGGVEIETCRKAREVRKAGPSSIWYYNTPPLKYTALTGVALRG